MQTLKNNENTPNSNMLHSLGIQRTNKSIKKSQSPSPSPISIRKTKPFQSLNSNQISRRQLEEDKENLRPNYIPQAPLGLRLDQPSVILQPINQFNLSSEISKPQSNLLPPISKSSIHQNQIGLIPISNHWNSTNQNFNQNERIDFIQETQSKSSQYSSFARGDLEGNEVDPFAQLSARTLALMDQPESEVTIYDCEYCDKTYQGKHARSIWRRHLSDKHKIPLSTQPRRTRWDNDVNRPKTEEERRERTLESKRRWARKNRAAKKAMRDGQLNSIDQSIGIHPNPINPESYRASPNRSRAPSPSSFPISIPHSTNLPSQYFISNSQLGRSQSIKAEHREQISGISRGASAPHAFSPYPPINSRASFPFSNSSYNSSFCIPQIPSPPEWTFPMSCSLNLSPYSFESISSNGSSGQFSDRFQQNHSPRNFHNLTRRHSLTTYPTESIHQLVDERRELPDSYSNSSSNSHYGNWELDNNSSNVSNSFPVNLTQVEESSNYETQFKRPRLSLASSTSIPLHKLDGLQKNLTACHIDHSKDNHDFQPIGINDLSNSSISSLDNSQFNIKHSPSNSVVLPDEEVGSETGPNPDENVNLQDNFRPISNSPLQSQDSIDQVQPTTRPATSGNVSSMSHENELDRVVPMHRAATEPQFTDRQSLQQTPNPSRTDPNSTSLYQGYYAPMNHTGKRVMSDNLQYQPFATSGSLNMSDWNNHGLDTPSSFSRFPFNSNVLSSPAGNAVIFGSPSNYLSKSLGLTFNSGSVSNEDNLGGFLGASSSTWDMVHQRT